MSNQNSRGFSLVEILIVLAIVGALAALGVSRLKRTENLKTSVRQLSTVLKKTRAYAKLYGKTYRVVFKMTDKEPHSYWVESTTQTHLIDADPNMKYKMSMDKEAKENADGFQTAPEIIHNPKTLPKDWKFSRIESSANPDAGSSEQVYIHFLPQGVSEEAIIQISNKSNSTTWTLHLNPLLSNPDLFQEAKSLKDFNQ